MIVPHLFLDFDGVFGNFDHHFFSLFGVDNRGMDGDKVWKLINSYPNFFGEMPLFEGAVEFFHGVAWMRPSILTSCSRSNYQHVARQKRQLIREKISPTVAILPVESRRNKPLFMHRQGDILVDDFPANITDWNAEGGVGIHHTDFLSTEAALVEALKAGVRVDE